MKFLTKVQVLLYLHTNCQIVVKLISIRAAAFVTANGVNTGIVSAWRSIAFILIYTLIMINMLDKAIRTATAISPHKILKRKIAYCEEDT